MKHKLILLLTPMILAACNSPDGPAIPEDLYIYQEYGLFLENGKYNAYANFRPCQQGNFRYYRIQLNNGASISVNGIPMTYDKSISEEPVIYPTWNYHATVSGPEATFVFTRDKEGSKVYTNTLTIDGLYGIYPLQTSGIIENNVTYYFDWTTNGDGPNVNPDDGPSDGEDDGGNIEIDISATYEIYLTSTTLNQNGQPTQIKGSIDISARTFRFGGVPAGTYTLATQVIKKGTVKENMPTCPAGTTQVGILLSYPGFIVN